MTLFSLVLLLVLIAIAVTLVVKLSGPYWDQVKLDGALVRMSDELRGKVVTEAEVEQRLNRILLNEDIDLDAADIISLSSSDSAPQLILDYDKRFDILGNIDVVLSFHETYGL